MTDPIADMLNRIRNAQAVIKPTVDIPWSNLKYEIAKILDKYGFIEGLEKRGRQPKKALRIILKYEGTGERATPVIRGLRRVSKPGQRIYMPSNKIRASKGGYGLFIISTSKGLMGDKEARKKKLGGELLCEIW